jgi:3-hydroxymyristoyl/3-hydroxydecanoyl-(acyl carrier protein) dehydratase
MHIHGPAGVGYGQFQNPANPTAPYWIQSFSGFASSQAGTFNGTLLVDGTVVKEEELLRGGYYFDLHTAASPNGEIRGQIIPL